MATEKPTTRIEMTHVGEILALIVQIPARWFLPVALGAIGSALSFALKDGKFGLELMVGWTTVAILGLAWLR